MIISLPFINIVSVRWTKAVFQIHVALVAKWKEHTVLWQWAVIKALAGPNWTTITHWRQQRRLLSRCRATQWQNVRRRDKSNEGKTSSGKINKTFIRVEGNSERAEGESGKWSLPWQRKNTRAPRSSRLCSGSQNKYNASQKVLWTPACIFAHGINVKRETAAILFCAN